MSKIGQQVIKLDQVTVKQDRHYLVITGPKGELKQRLHPRVTLEIKDQLLRVKVRNPEDKFDRALWGLYRSLINNLVIGVTSGFEKRLEIHGVGFKAIVDKQTLILHVGFSHPIEFSIPEGIKIQVAGNQIVITGIDKQLIGEVASQIRGIKEPEPYKGKGIKYIDEVIRRKAGKVIKGEATAGGGK